MNSVCRICLVGNMKLCSLENNLLIEIYEKLSNTKFKSQDARPKALCCFCYQKLLRCQNFSQMVYRSENIFSYLIDQGLEATQKYISEVNLGINQPLSFAIMAHVNVNDNVTDTGSLVAIKDEPTPSDDLQEEVTTEQDELVKVKSKQQLSLEADQRNSAEEPLSYINVEQTKPDDPKITFKCNNCNKIFFLKSKPSDFACNVCNKQFAHKSYLDRHMSSHTGEKPYACNVCDKHFRHKFYLVRHMITHTGEKPYACNECDKQFRQKGHLVGHMKTHTGEKPFACNVCDKQFRRKGELIRHHKTHSIPTENAIY